MTTCYSIRVQGHLDDTWSEAFEGLVIERLPNGQTRLSGPLPDQAALHGVLGLIASLNLSLLEVTVIEPSDGRGAGGDAGGERCWEGR